VVVQSDTRSAAEDAAGQNNPPRYGIIDSSLAYYYCVNDNTFRLVSAQRARLPSCLQGNAKRYRPNRRMDYFLLNLIDLFGRRELLDRAMRNPVFRAWTEPMMASGAWQVRVTHYGFAFPLPKDLLLGMTFLTG
jgi:hypothetical protein